LRYTPWNSNGPFKQEEERLKLLEKLLSRSNLPCNVLEVILDDVLTLLVEEKLVIQVPKLEKY